MIHLNLKYFSAAGRIIAATAIWVIMFSCKKVENTTPTTKNGLKLFNFTTGIEAPYDISVNWIHMPNGEVWTWTKDGNYKIFDKNQNLREFTIPFAQLAPGNASLPQPATYSFNLNTYYIYSVNASGNLTHAYLDTILDGFNQGKLYLCKNEITPMGQVIGQDSVCIARLSSEFTIKSFKMTQNEDHFYFAFHAGYYDPIQSLSQDSLHVLMSDKQLNIQKKYSQLPDMTIFGWYSDAEVKSIAVDNNRLSVVYNSYNNDSREALLLFDENLNVVKNIKSDEIFTTDNLSELRIFKKIIARNGLIYLFGDFETVDNSNNYFVKLMMTVMDKNGNYLFSKIIQKNKNALIFKGVELQTDDKFVLFYDETDDQTSYRAGVSKLDVNGNLAYQLVFPESLEAYTYAQMAFEDGNGFIHLYGTKYYNNNAVEQTFFVKLNAKGEIQ